ncbi:MAG: hypothetical protein LBQ83_08105 [Candidatus Margulisbacteria bacterium]|jgi:lipopolysaccharide export system protein LptA|nr:hypothetical protein [Candidatus Margulisiibacteriota bacterium]
MKPPFFNKNTLIFACLGLFALLFIYLMVSAGELENADPAVDKKIEIDAAAIRGYKNGELLWSMQSRYIWSAMSIDHAIVENIYNGRFYDQGRILLDSLSARKVQVNAPQERFYADKGFKAVMYRGHNPGQPVDIWGEQLNYNAADKKSRLHKQIQVFDRNTKINAERATIDHQNNQITFGKDFTLSRPDSSLTAEKLLIDIDKDIFHAGQNVRLIRQPEDGAAEFKKQKTTIYTDELTADISQELARLQLSGNVLIKQNDKQAVGATAVFDEKDQLFHLNGQATALFDKTAALLDAATRQKLKNQEILQEKLQLQSDSIIINTDSQDLQAYGSVRVTIKNQEATADTAEYQRTAEKIYLRGGVLLQQADGSLVKAGQVVVDIPTEKFEALGQAESIIYLNR